MHERPILVVDDDPAIREAVALMLELEGYSVRTAANGLEALSRIEETPPACVVLDLQMPVLDGWAVAQALAAQGMNYPVVVMTAAPESRRWARDIGAVACLSKPFNIDDLLAEVELVVGH